MTFPDVMVDIETTGTRPDRAAVIQLSAVRFCLKTRQIDTANMFDAALSMPAWRSWDEDTRRWWRQQNPAVLNNILTKMRPPPQVMAEFITWANQDGLDSYNRFFWAKNASFDSQFIASYCTDFELPNPFHYRSVRDMRTFILGRSHPEGLPDVEETKTDQAHNSLVDCITQIDWLFKAYDAVEVNRAPNQIG